MSSRVKEPSIFMKIRFHNRFYEFKCIINPFRHYRRSRIRKSFYWNNRGYRMKYFVKYHIIPEKMRRKWWRFKFKFSKFWFSRKRIQFFIGNNLITIIFPFRTKSDSKTVNSYLSLLNDYPDPANQLQKLNQIINDFQDDSIIMKEKEFPFIKKALAPKRLYWDNKHKCWCQEGFSSNWKYARKNSFGLLHKELIGRISYYPLLILREVSKVRDKQFYIRYWKKKYNIDLIEEFGDFHYTVEVAFFYYNYYGEHEKHFNFPINLFSSFFIKQQGYIYAD